MIKGEKTKLESIAVDNLCAEHNKPLNVAWVGDASSYAIRCSLNHYPDAVTRNKSDIEIIKQAPKSIVPKNAFGVTPVDLGSKQSLTPAEINILVEYAEHYGLDAYRGHVVMMYSKPYICLDGYLFEANRSKRPYEMRSRPMNAEELKAYKVGDADFGWLCEIAILNPNTYHCGIGIVTAAEMNDTSAKDAAQKRAPVVAKHPQLMAQKRAEWQALRRAFPIGEESNGSLDKKVDFM